MDPAGELAELVQALSGHLARRSVLGPARVPRPVAAARAPAPASAPRAEEARPEVPRSPAAAPAASAQPSIPPAPAPDELRPFAPESPAPPEPDSPAVRENAARAGACADLGELRRLVASCEACSLARTRTQTVFSDGPERARVMFVGEAPGEHEDRQGVPFVGAAGQLLTDIIQKGMGLPRAEVSIVNVLKCRPPGNRDPEPEEKALCTPYLDRQIELVAPDVIVALGLHAARHLLRSPLSMGRLRGKVHLWRGRKVVATYHPAYLLRTPSAKKDCWQDIQLAMRELGLTPPGPSRGTGR